MNKSLKSCKRELKDLDSKQGIVTLYANTFNKVDAHNDISAPGSFTRTIKGGGNERVKQYIDHMVSMKYMVGVPMEMMEDSEGLLIRSKLNLKKGLARDLMADYEFFAENGKAVEHSIGFEIKQRDENDQRIIKEYKLWEYSAVALGANQWSVATDLKSMNDEKLIKETSSMLEQLLTRNYSTERLKGIESQIKSLHNLIKGVEPQNALTSNEEEARLIKSLETLKNNFK